jgi:hypothetical protein
MFQYLQNTDASMHQKVLFSYLDHMWASLILNLTISHKDYTF